MAKNQTLDDFYKSFREEVLCASDTETSGWTTDDFLTAVMLEYLEEAGEATDPVICPFRDRGLQMNAYAFSEDFESVDIFVSIYSDVSLDGYYMYCRRKEEKISFICFFYRDGYRNCM